MSCCSLARCCSLWAMVRLHWVGWKIGERESRRAHCMPPGLPALELLLVGDIEQIGTRTAACAGDLRDDLVELVSPARRDCDDRSPRRQATGRLGAKSGSATDDQHNLGFASLTITCPLGRRRRSRPTRKVFNFSSRMGSSVPSRSCPPRTPREAWPASSCWHWR